MVENKKAQAAFEYLVTYGWAMLAALIAVGALLYFGFLNPSNLLPNQCDFGTQLECVEYRIVSDESSITRADIVFRNNFGKDINIIGVGGDAVGVNPGSPNTLPFTIPAGETREVWINLNNVYLIGDKKEAIILVRFERAGVPNPPSHNISGRVFVTVQPVP